MCAWARQRSDFQPVEFYRAIQKYGYIVQWEKSSLCPCIPKTGQGQPDFNCPLCFGKGRYWFDPKQIRGIMTSLSEDVRFQQLGEIDQGTSYFTTTPDNKLGFWDRLTNFDSKIRFSEVVEKGDSSGKDRLRFKPISILNIRTITTPFEIGKDYMLSESDQSIDWKPTGNAPVRGERYSVEYLLHPRWICISPVNVLRDTYTKSKKAGITFTELPIRVMAKLEFFVV
jgi:hypothetical protein